MYRRTNVPIFFNMFFLGICSETKKIVHVYKKRRCAWPPRFCLEHSPGVHVLRLPFLLQEADPGLGLLLLHRHGDPAVRRPFPRALLIATAGSGTPF